jgi:creatinine amidohydrolase/Fe(II)-dependent formamide hydrolase-like protein
MLNAHGGNSPLMTIAATELRVRFNMLAVATSWTRFGLPDGLMSAEEKHLDIHGGLIETSVMLAIHPELVQMGKAANFNSRQAEYIRNTGICAPTVRMPSAGRCRTSRRSASPATRQARRRKSARRSSIMR